MVTAVHKLQGAGGVGGDSYWIALLGGAGDELGLGMGLAQTGDIIVAGYTINSINSHHDGLIVKYDTSGTPLWSKILGGSGSDLLQDAVVDSSDNIIVCGYTDSDGAGGLDALVAKYNSSGTLLWSKTLGGSTTDYFMEVATDSSDNIIACGATASSSAGASDILITKYNSSGTLLWSKRLGGAGNDFGRRVVVDPSDNIVICGEIGSNTAGGYDLLVAKYNSSGTLLWSKRLGGAGADYGRGVSLDSSGNIIVCGHTGSDGAGGNDLLVAKYNSSGTLLWDKTLGGVSDEIGAGVSVDSSDNIIVCGYTDSDGAGGLDALVAKLHPDGLGDGTYGSLVYQDAVLTDAAAVLTDATASLTAGTAVLTDAAAVLTEELLPITI